MSQDNDGVQRYARVEVQMRARISTLDPELDPWSGKTCFRSSEETCANVSRGGAYLVTAEPLEPGRRLLIELDTPEGGHLQTIGRVVWTKTQLAPAGNQTHSGIGVEFLGAMAEQFRALDDFLQRATRLPRAAKNVNPHLPSRRA